MNTLHLLLVDADCDESARLVTMLSGANHCVLGAGDLQEASEALLLQKFDAVLLGSTVPPAAVPEFAASLRKMEQRQLGYRIPVFSISSDIAAEQGWSRTPASPLDGYLAEQFDPETLTQAVRSLENRQTEPLRSGISGAPASGYFDQPSAIFLSAEFREQCAGEPELMVEIIDLFLSEQEHELRNLRNSLAAAQYEQLSYAAHTLKGSLGSLHAAESRGYAESLEAAAKAKSGSDCSHALLALEEALARLKPAIQTFRTHLLQQ